MAKSRLRIYYGPETSSENPCLTTSTSKVEENKVHIPLKEIFGLLADAVQSQRTWLQDFEDEEITISSDLYEVILAYQFCRKPVA